MGNILAPCSQALSIPNCTNFGACQQFFWFPFRDGAVSKAIHVDNRAQIWTFHPCKIKGERWAKCLSQYFKLSQWYQPLIYSWCVASARTGYLTLHKRLVILCVVSKVTRQASFLAAVTRTHDGALLSEAITLGDCSTSDTKLLANFSALTHLH